MIFRVEDVYGSKFDDKLIGDTHDNMLDGGDGNDILKGGGGIDTLFGGNGDDVFQVDGLQDTIHGGDGHRYADVHERHRNRSTSISSAGDSSSRVGGPGCRITPHSFVYDVENVIGTEAHDKLDVGRRRRQQAHGRQRRRRFLLGRGGNDVLEGGTARTTGSTAAPARTSCAAARARTRSCSRSTVDSVWGGGRSRWTDHGFPARAGQDRPDRDGSRHRRSADPEQPERSTA